MQTVEASVLGNGTFRTLLMGLFGPTRFFVLLATYWIGFVSDFGLYRRQTSQQGTILVPGLFAPKPARTWTSRPIFLSGSSRTTFRVTSSHLLLFINAILLCVKICFLNRLLYIGKFYHISCNTALRRLFNSVNPLCLYVCIYTNKYYYYYNTVEEF